MTIDALPKIRAVPSLCARNVLAAETMSPFHTVASPQLGSFNVLEATIFGSVFIRSA
jgi:hypothetical protein